MGAIQLAFTKLSALPLYRLVALVYKLKMLLLLKMGTIIWIVILTVKDALYLGLILVAQNAMIQLYYTTILAFFHAQ
jgi:hypothetical protein